MAIIQDNLGQNTLTVDSTGSASVKITNIPSVSFNNNDFSKDSFERLRVSQPVVVFEDSFAALLPNAKTTIWEAAAVATGPTLLQVGLMMLATPNTGATYAVTTGGSAAVIDIAATPATAVTGTLIWSGLIPNVVGCYTFDLSTLNDNMNVIGTAASGTQAITGAGNLTVVAGCVQTATVGASVVASLNWKELV